MVNMAPDTPFDNGSNPGQFSEDPRYVERQAVGVMVRATALQSQGSGFESRR